MLQHEKLTVKKVIESRLEILSFCSIDFEPYCSIKRILKKNFKNNDEFLKNEETGHVLFFGKKRHNRKYENVSLLTNEKKIAAIFI